MASDAVRQLGRSWVAGKEPHQLVSPGLTQQPWVRALCGWRLMAWSPQDTSFRIPQSLIFVLIRE